ncbi:MAG: sensor histidine kinase [Saprospiraceae bacterium]
MTLLDTETGERLVYLVPEKWTLYFQFAGSALLLFLPVVLFSFFRNLFKKILNYWLFRLLWVYCFVIHIVLMFHYNIDQFFSALRVHVDTPVIFGIAILVVELIIQLNDFLTKKLDIVAQLKKIKVERAFLLLIVSIALLFSFPPFNRSIVGHGDLVYYVGEVFLDFLKWLLLFFTIYLFYRINHYLLIEKVFKTKGLFYYVFSFIGLAMLFLPIFAIIINDFLVSGQTWRVAPEMWIPKGEQINWFYVFPNFLPWQWMFSTIPLILVYQWWKQKNDIITLEKEKSASELNALKQQVNPHFLFNTLNSLYALGIEEESEKTADGIAKLGTLMRYNLNDAQKDFISLSKEIDYIKKYIELQELRITSNNEVRINLVRGNLEGYQIAPLLLIPFIENAFKYGISTTEKTFTELNIEIHKDWLVMDLVNSVITQKETKSSNGIGLSNTRKRLAALYPKQYELIIEETPSEFEVHLEINLA